MTLDAWLRAAIADAEQRGLPDLKPLLEGLALATSGLRAANLTADAGGAPRDRTAGTAEAADLGSAVHPPDRLPR
jgi:hypothetical protein